VAPTSYTNGLLSLITYWLFTYMFSLLYHCQHLYRALVCIWATWRVSYKKQELLTLREHLSWPRFFSGHHDAHILFCIVLLCIFTLWVPCWDIDVGYNFRKNRCSVCLYLHLFVGRLVSYLRYLFLFTYSLIQHILCCAFVFFSSSCVPYVDSFSGLSIFDWPFDILFYLLECTWFDMNICVLTG